jgi:dTDP-glucose 4,6-dehydratase
MALETGTPGETYNVGGNSERKNIDLVRQICHILDELSPRQGGKKHAELVHFVTDRPGHDFRYAIDSSKIQSELKWKPKHDLEESLRKTVQWYLSNRNWWQEILDGTYQLQRLGKGSEQTSR